MNWTNELHVDDCTCQTQAVLVICRADAVTDLDEGAAPSDATQGPAEGQAGTGPQTDPGSEAQQQAAEDHSAFLRQDGESADAYARRIFERVYGHDIERVLRMEVRSAVCKQPLCCCQKA